MGERDKHTNNVSKVISTNVIRARRILRERNKGKIDWRPLRVGSHLWSSEILAESQRMSWPVPFETGNHEGNHEDERHGEEGRGRSALLRN